MSDLVDIVGVIESPIVSIIDGVFIHQMFIE